MLRNWRNLSISRVLTQAIQIQNSFWSIAVFAFLISTSSSSSAQTDPLDPDFRWHNVAPGYQIGRYALTRNGSVLKSEVLVLKFDPKLFALRLINSEQTGQPKNDIQQLTTKAGGIAGINAHFFDPDGKPLGLGIDNGKVFNRLHKGGGLLTAVFLMNSFTPSIIDRSEAENLSAEVAIQAGPLLIRKGTAQNVASAETTSRRSGIAVTRTGMFILYATLLRFPGASLKQIQQMLLDPSLDVLDALNLDGGGSSQLFVKQNPALADDTFISGGDLVPTGLIVLSRK